MPRFDARDALADIETLADDIGPREATSKNFDEAADLVEKRFEKLGYDVATEKVTVPAGNSWGTPVRAGTSRNVIADPVGFDDEEPHVVVVAHLDTVPVAPGAEDNASGISVLLELARMAAITPPDLPVRFIAFGAEEPRGAGDALHHFGSQQHVEDLSRAERRAIKGVVALDRVGVRASYVPVCSARASGNDLRADVRAAARKVDVPTRGCGGNTTSDHWSYVKAGIPGIRLGSVPYAGYHSRGDTPDVVDRRQLDRVGTVMWAWLQSCDHGPGVRSTAGGPDVVEDVGGPVALHHPRHETRVEHVRHRLDRLHPVAPQHDLDEDPLHRLGLEVHVEDEVAERVHDHGVAPGLPALHPVGMAADHQVGPGVGEGSGGTTLAGFGHVGVLGAPVRDHHHHVDPLDQVGDVAGDPVELAFVQRSCPRRHVQPVGAAPVGGGRRGLADRLGAEEADPDAVAGDHHGLAGLVQVATGPHVRQIRVPELGERLPQRTLPVVADVVVGQRDQVEAGQLQSLDDLRVGVERVAALGG